MSEHKSPIHRLIRSYYDQAAEREWERLEICPTEYAVTVRALDKYLPPAPARVLDCGGGPGRYAIELAQRGYEVTLFDLSAESLRLAEERAKAAGVTLDGYEHGTATDLSRFPDANFDAVLLMGPLYHLLEEQKRLAALREAYRVSKPGVPLFAAFIGRYAAHLDAAAGYPDRPPEDAELYETILSTGLVPPRSEEDPGFVAYLAHPEEVTPLCRRAGFEVETVLAAEGLISTVQEKISELPDEAWQWWLNVNHRVADDPSIHGAAEHLLVVARKPRWRALLRRIARRLEEAGVVYKVVAGAAAALHGVPTPVADIDIETDAEGAYRFGELFTDHVLQPVSLGEGGECYRSHFGRFEVDGVSVDVMGDLERREGDDWVPTATKTETTVNLDGVPIRVSWLEEEVLAYVRRGRLDRAARCLPHCDHGRLLALLHGERETDVL